ncbi:MAG: ATP-binding protein [Acidimicrobiia bacterium]
MSTAGLVTILFTDLVGSTALSQELGDHAADDVRREHFEVLRQAVSRTGGTEVKTIGDALMVSYPAAADAVAGAVAMQQGVARHNRRGAGPRLEMRIGISAGDATFEDGDWFGTPVVEAARLCAAAEGGQILATEIVKVLGGTRVGHPLVSVAPIAAKGIAEPVAACQVVWEPEEDEIAESRAVPLPPVVATPNLVTLVGRDTERSVVVDAWKEVVAGGRRVVLVAGEPGIGKTRLVKDVCQLAHDHGGAVLWGGCEEELSVPYQPFVEAIRWYSSVADLDELRSELGPLGGELTRLVPELARIVPGLDAPVSADADTERYRLFEAAVEFFAALSARGPVLLVLDDVHWAAKPTLLLLRHILRATAPMNLLVVATYRDTDLDRTHPLAEMLADLRREPGVERLALTGLDEQGVVAFLEHTAGHELDAPGLELARVVHAETEGNPFFVGEVLRHLAESGALVFRDGRWTSDLTADQFGIPEGVREVVGRRLSRLESSANEVLSIASVIGRDFDLGLLAAIVPGGEDAALDGIEAAETSGLVVPVPGRAASYRFSHALVRTTLYDELTTSRRLRLHRDVGRALVARPDADARLPELARHFSEAAALGEVDRAIEFCTRAAEAARAELAFEEAAAHYERALGALDLAETDDPVRRCDLLLARGRALLAVADSRAVGSFAAAAEVARGVGDPLRLADAALGAMDDADRRNYEVDVEAAGLAEEALAALPESARDRRALVMAKLARLLMHSDQAVRRGALVDGALELARQDDDPAVLGQVLFLQQWGYDFRDPGLYDRYMGEGTELAGIATMLGDPEMLFEAHGHRLLGEVMLGDRDAADADLVAIEELAQRLRQPVFERRARVLRAAMTLLSGRLDEAEAQIAALAAFQQVRGLEDVGSGALNYRLYFERGRLADIEPLVAAMVETQPQIPAWRVALSGIYTSTDDLDRARIHVEALAADDWAMVPRNNLWQVTIAGAARTAALSGALDIAARALDLMLPFRHTVTCTGQSFEQPVALSLGTAAATLGAPDLADELFAEALDLSQRVRAPTFVAATQVAWAEALAARDDPGDAERARELAIASLAAAEELGLGRVAELSRRVLG